MPRSSFLSPGKPLPVQNLFPYICTQLVTKTCFLEEKQPNIVFGGAGSIGTAIGNILARAGRRVTLFTIEEHVAVSINEHHINPDYFPNAPLSGNLSATTEAKVLKQADVIFLAIHSIITVDFVLKHKKFIRDDAILINLAKGFGCGKLTITACLNKMVQNPVCTMKGPTFAREIMNHAPTAMTFASADEQHFAMAKELFRETNILLDYTTDLEGVEVLSILKNIYAIILGIVDANFDSPNLRFLILTRGPVYCRPPGIFYAGLSGTGPDQSGQHLHSH